MIGRDNTESIRVREAEQSGENSEKRDSQEERRSEFEFIGGRVRTAGRRNERYQRGSAAVTLRLLYPRSGTLIEDGCCNCK